MKRRYWRDFLLSVGDSLYIVVRCFIFYLYSAS